MSEPEAWREIARRIDERETPMRNGLCFEVYALYEAVGDSTFDCMIARVDAHAALSPFAWRAGFGDGAFAFKPGTERRSRILAALFLALESEDDANA